MNYEQLCGALGALKTSGVKLDWKKINNELLEIAKNQITVNTEAEPLLRKYRRLCLDIGIIRPGELFCLNDCVPLI